MALVQSGTAGATNGVTVNIPVAPTSGNLLIGVHFTRASTSIPPTGFGTAVLINNATEADQGAIYFKVSDGSEGTSYVFGSAVDHHAAAIYEYSGMGGTPFDTAGSVGRTTGVTTLNSGTTGVIAQADELLIAAISVRANVTSPAWDNSFTQRDLVIRDGGGGAFAGLIIGDRIVAAQAAYNSQGTWTTSATAMGMIATFKVAVAAGTVTFLPHMMLMGAG